MSIEEVISEFNGKIPIENRRYDESKIKDIAINLMSLCTTWKEKLSDSMSLKLKIHGDNDSVQYGIDIDTLPLTILKIIASNNELPNSIELVSFSYGQNVKHEETIGHLSIS